MNFKKIEEELKQNGIISIYDSVVNEGQLYNALFGKKEYSNERKRIIGEFISGHMSEKEFAQFVLIEKYLEEIYSTVKIAGMIKEFVQKFVYYYAKKEHWEFGDYEHVIAFGFRFCENLLGEELLDCGIVTDYEGKRFSFYDCVAIGLSYAGEQHDLGRAFNGGSIIRKYAKYIDASIAEGIFLAAKRPGGSSAIDTRYLFQIIDRCQAIIEIKRKDLQFKYIYYPYFRENLTVFLDGLFTGFGYDIYLENGSILNNNYGEVLCCKKGKLGIAVFAVEKEKNDGVRFEIVCGEDKLFLQMKLTEERDLKYCIKDDNRTNITVEATDINVIANKEIVDNFEMHKAFIKVLKNLTDELEKVLKHESTEEIDNYLETLCIYVKSIYGKVYDKLLALSNEYSYFEKKIKNASNESFNIELRLLKQDDVKKKRDFFTVKKINESKKEHVGHITNINALIGKNGSGKTSITNMLMQSGMFGDVFSKRDVIKASYCVVFRVGKNLYYSSTEYEENWIKVTCDKETVRPYHNTEQNSITYKNMINTTVVMYHNTINPLEMDFIRGVGKPVQSNRRRNISTSHILSQENKRLRFMDILHVMNLMEDIEEITDNESMKGIEKYQNSIDFFERFDIKEIDEVTRLSGWQEDVVNRKEFLNAYIEFVKMQDRNKDIFFQINNVSTGESARLLLFARLHSVFHVNKKYRPFLLPDGEVNISNQNRRGNYLLLLDEIESFFHPTWQRKIVYDLIDFLEWEEEYFQAYDNVHIILSSNSPFFLSDLPKTNLVRLDEQIDCNYREQTFGENIHSILKNAFLKENGLMGEFAQTKINEAFDILHNGEIRQEEWEYVDEIKNLIEEPILKSAFMEIYEKALERTGNKAKRIAEYEKQMEELRKKMKELQGEQ